jgi:ABC-type transport system substrate-binding protein
MTRRRTLLLGASAAGLLPAISATVGVLSPAEVSAQIGSDGRVQKTLRYAFLVAETSLDPVKVNDLYSRTLTPHIFEAPLRYDHLARPIKIRPNTAEAMPEFSEDFRVWTVKIKRGIYFADDPAFKGKKRELVAQDYVYAFKRYADPANLSPGWSAIETFSIIGLTEVHDVAVGKRFDYDKEVEGMRAIDRYTLQFKLKEPRPRFHENLAANDLFGAVAREVVELYGDQIDAHPVGTGPFKLVQWRRSSRIVFERNPDYREVFYDAEPAEDDHEGQAILARLKGKRIPMIDRVEVSIIEAQQPRWLSFVNGEADFIERVGSDFIGVAMPASKVAPNLAKRGIRGYQQVEPGSSMVLFNLDSPVVGGYTPEKIALRRAFGLAMDTNREISLARKGQAIASQSPINPFTTGYDPKFKSEMSEFDPARANGLLDLYGYIDRNGDGWREMPDGSPLTIEYSAQADSNSRQLDELMIKNLTAIGVRVKMRFAQWPENLKSARAGSFMVWAVGGSADVPDGQSALARYDSRQIGGQNMARFKQPAFDALYDHMLRISDGPERDALFLEAKRIAVAYMPYKMRVSRIVTDMSYPWVFGYRRTIFWQEWWHCIDIDTSLLPKA